MSYTEIEEYKIRLEAQMRQILKDYSYCTWLKEALKVDDADATEKAGITELDEFLSSLDES